MGLASLHNTSLLCVWDDRCVSAVASVLFFQAEDGIRDLVRSRGLGDVYKRQTLSLLSHQTLRRTVHRRADARGVPPDDPATDPLPVSYTHLTLPTSDLV